MGRRKPQTELRIIHVPIAELVPYARNAKLHSDEQVKQIAASIEEFGFNNPVLIDGQRGIIAGHGRVMAAEMLGMESVPCIELLHLTDDQRRAYILADNKLGETGGGWDLDLLKFELQTLQDDGFDITLTGFTAADLESYLEDEEEDEPGDGEGSINRMVICDCESEDQALMVMNILQKKQLPCRIEVS